MAAEVNEKPTHQEETSLLPSSLEEKCLNFILKNMWGKFCKFMEEDISNRENVVRFFDNMLDEDFEADVLRRHSHFHGRLSRNIVKKWLGKIVKLYEFPKGICPNLLLSHRMGFISYVSHLYIKKITSYCNWRDLIVYISADCISTQKKVVQKLCLLGMIEEAARFANDFNLDDEDWPIDLQQERQRCLNEPLQVTEDDLLWSTDDEESDEVEDSTHPYYYFPHPRPKILMIKNKEKFQHCIEHLSHPGSIVGVDLEWQTLFNSETNRDSIALIQLALLECIYIVDVITLAQILSKDDWTHFFNKIFNSKTVVKLGYSFTQDLNIIAVTFPFIDTKEFSNIIDLQTTVKKSSNVKHKGLSGLVEQHFSRPLNKAYQISCWERRPLRKCQVIYAALDAYVLLQLHKVNLNNGEESSDPSSVSLSDDSTTIPCDCDETKELALQGNRIVLTAGRVYQMFASRLGENKCFSVSSQNVKEQLMEVLTHFNVKVKEEDLLSRCQICNCKTFVLVESEKMHVLKEVKPSSSSTKKKSWISDPNGSDAVESIPDPDMLFSSMVTHPVNKLESYPVLENEELIDMDTALYRSNGVAIQLEHIPNTLFAEDKIFYCCISCGKVYWDGCHYKRMLKQFHSLMMMRDNQQ
ncbi:exonuclease mut-7 homolog isoform X3 [Octopus sinensis]|uniref:Exonuclease mut-7 homolog isoform X3 n=1 Tax=Octopus sinensis TaxID=2607531 RepID=A0A7E6ENP0_9MOLL|nr:exonuclease mut-7 homolog isoform X3 [Octopus sinensis]